MKYRIVRLSLVLGVCLSLAHAQQTSTEEHVKGTPSTHVMVRAGTVLAVEGDNLIVKMQDGEVKHFNVPPDSKFEVNGSQVGLSELKPGTELTQSLITTRTPTVVRTTTKISGRVFAVNAPTSVVLTLPGGENRRYYLPEGQKINVGGEEVDAFALKPGMKINATVTKEVPMEDVEVKRGAVSGMAPAEPAPEPTTTAQNTQPEATPAPAPESPAPEEKKALPQTASTLPLLALLGVGLTLLGWKGLSRNA